MYEKINDNKYLHTYMDSHNSHKNATTSRL